MELIKWLDGYSVGIEEVDNQHKVLVEIINELFTQISQGKAKDNLNEIFDRLTEYTKVHFKDEEAMLVKFAYPDIISHRFEHNKFVKKLSEMKLEFDSSKITISLEILNFLKDWFINHILITDMKYSEYIKNQV